jgi:AraC family transcriptional regulator, regulatory protein of adaptative response / methylated-DNA-[protein]-cysteine methyltransferase
MELSFDDKYNILVNRDPTYEGLFIVAVKTTKIFCKPVCTARNPRPENVTFYDTIEEAIENGFRPCKKCRPLEPVNALPPAFKALIDHLEAHPHERIKDSDLAQWDIAPSQIRRWFRKYYQTTFQTYQRNLRMSAAHQKINAGAGVSDTAFDSGFDSLSGFTERFRSTFGTAPSDASSTIVINVKQILTPLGPMYGGADENGIYFIEFFDRVKLEEELTALCKELNAVILPGQNTHLQQLETELGEYFDRQRTEFTVPLQLIGSAFQQDVWRTLMAIPYGTTWSYKQQALHMNNLLAIRAIAAANGQNKHAILIPCHRVIGSNGKLTGYAGGLHRKEWLLKLETEHVQKATQLSLL